MAIVEAEVEAKIKPGMKITEDELMRLPKDGRKWELVDGRLTEVPTSIQHEEIIFNVTVLFAPFVRGHGLVTLGQGGFRMTDGNIRAPDVSFTLKERFPGGHAPNTFGDLAPDLCVEIISPSERKADMDRKVWEYFERGAQFVWHVFPEQQQVTVFTSPTDTQTFGADDTLEAGDVMPGFSCRVTDIFQTE